MEKEQYRDADIADERKGRALILVFLTIFFLFSGLAKVAAKGKAPPIASPPLVNASQLKGTIVADSLREPIAGNKNIIWCASQQMAWDKLSDVLREPIILKDASELSAAMNIHFTRDFETNSSSIWVFAGKNTGRNRRRLSEKIKKKFSDTGSVAPGGNCRDGGILLYSWFNRLQRFPYSFNPSPEPFIFDGKPVASWNCLDLDEKPKLAGQVSIIPTVSDDDCIVAINCSNLTEFMILAKVKPEKTLIGTIEKVERMVHSNLAYFYPHPHPHPYKYGLVASVLNFDILRTYTELSGKHVVMSTRKCLEDAGRICLDKQRLRFQLTGEGDKTAQVLPKGHNFDAIKDGGYFGAVFDKPFLILLQRRLAWNPFFALWVANTELMVPMDKKLPENLNDTMNELLAQKVQSATRKLSIGSKQVPEKLASMDILPFGATRSIEVLKTKMPTFPRKLQMGGERAKVIIKVVVDEEGNVIYAGVLQSNNHHFDKSCLQAARQWKFTKPVTKDGKPAKVWYFIPFKFVPGR